MIELRQNTILSIDWNYYIYLLNQLLIKLLFCFVCVSVFEISDVLLFCISCVIGHCAVQTV